jgi:hypothetical protein
MGFSQIICLGWPQTAILLISAFQVARISGVSYWHLAFKNFGGAVSFYVEQALDLLIPFHSHNCSQ